MITIKNTYELNIFGGSAYFPYKFWLNVIVLIGFGDFLVEGICLSSLVSNGSFVHVWNLINIFKTVKNFELIKEKEFVISWKE